MELQNRSTRDHEKAPLIEEGPELWRLLSFPEAEPHLMSSSSLPAPQFALCERTNGRGGIQMRTWQMENSARSLLHIAQAQARTKIPFTEQRRI